MPDHDEWAEAIAAVEQIASIRVKAEFCFRWMSAIDQLDTPVTSAVGSCST
jgi:ribonucleoside-diphosphate reductase beta chain